MKKLLLILVPVFFVSCVYTPYEPEKDKNIRSKTTYENFSSINQPIGFRKQYQTAFAKGSGKKFDHYENNGYLFFVYDWENDKVATYTYCDGTLANAYDYIMPTLKNSDGVTKLYSAEYRMNHLSIMSAEKNSLEGDYYKDIGAWSNVSVSDGRYAILTKEVSIPQEKDENVSKYGTAIRILDVETDKLSEPVYLYGILEKGEVSMTNVDAANESWFIYTPLDSENSSIKHLGKYDITTNAVSDAGPIELASLFTEANEDDAYYSYSIGFSTEDSVFIWCERFVSQSTADGEKSGKEYRSNLIAQINKATLKITNYVLLEDNVDLSNLIQMNDRILAIGEIAGENESYHVIYKVNNEDFSARQIATDLKLVCNKVLIRGSRIYFILCDGFSEKATMFYWDTEKETLSEEIIIDFESIIE